MDPVGICNLALHRIGAAPISNLETDNTKSAVACQAFYANARDTMLTLHTWAFAGEVQSLTSLTDDGKTKYLYKYSLPVDPWCLRPRAVKDSTFSDTAYPYRQMGRYIYTDLSPAWLEYTARMEDPDDWDPLFVEAIAWLLAVELIRPLGNKSDVDADGQLRAALLLARGIDADQSQEKETPPTSWTVERFGS